MMNDILMVGLLYIAVLVEIIILGEINLLSHYYLFVGAFSIYTIYISILIVISLTTCKGEFLWRRQRKLIISNGHSSLSVYCIFYDRYRYIWQDRNTWKYDFIFKNEKLHAKKFYSFQLFVGFSMYIFN